MAVQVRHQLRGADQAQHGEEDGDEHILGRMHAQIIPGKAGQQEE